jgi:hypothetical protein
MTISRVTDSVISTCLHSTNTIARAGLWRVSRRIRVSGTRFSALACADRLGRHRTRRIDRASVAGVRAATGTGAGGAWHVAHVAAEGELKEMPWFGTDWTVRPETERRSGWCETLRPVNAHCYHCVEPIEPTDSGMQYPDGEYAHRNCFLRQILGPVAHIEQRCSSYVRDSEEGDPEGLTPRQAANAAVAALGPQTESEGELMTATERKICSILGLNLTDRKINIRQAKQQAEMKKLNRPFKFTNEDRKRWKAGMKFCKRYGDFSISFVGREFTVMDNRKKIGICNFTSGRQANAIARLLATNRCDVYKILELSGLENRKLSICWRS